MDINDEKVNPAIFRPMHRQKIWQVLSNMKPLLSICLGLWIILAMVPTTTAVCPTAPTCATSPTCATCPNCPTAPACPTAPTVTCPTSPTCSTRTPACRTIPTCPTSTTWSKISNGAICPTLPTIPTVRTIPGTTATTYGTLIHTNVDDNDRNYVLTSDDYVVMQPNGTITDSYIEQVTFDFAIAPQPGAQIWLYAMDRNGSTNQFTPTARFLIPSPLIRKGSRGAGIQTIFLSCIDLPISAGQYLAVGFNSIGGSCYRNPNLGEYFVSLGDSGFATLSETTYAFRAAEHMAFTFVVRTIDDSFTLLPTDPSSSINTASTYGTLFHTNVDDNDRGFVVIREDSVVMETCGATSASYVERVTFDFNVAPQAGAEIWLYVMNRNGSTDQFTPSVSFLIPSSLIQIGSNGVGIQTIVLNSTNVPISVGQYLGLGFNSVGGSCYRTPDTAEHFILQSDSGFATLSKMTYTYAPNEGAAFTFDVRTIGDNSG